MSDVAGACVLAAVPAFTGYYANEEKTASSFIGTRRVRYKDLALGKLASFDPHG